MNLSAISSKVLTASLVLAASTGLALAKNYKGENYKGEAMPAPCPTPAMLMDGFYVGAQAGYDSYRVRNNYAYTVPAGSISGNPVLNASGWVGGLFLGYGQYFNNLYYLAGEVFGNASGASQNQTFSASYAGGPVNTTNTKFEVNSSFGLSILPGIKLNDTSLGYVRLGWNWANMKAKGTVSVAGASYSKTNTSNGFDFGLGIETLVMNNWSVRTEYNHTYYNSFSAAGSTFNPSDNQFTLGVLYHFA